MDKETSIGKTNDGLTDDELKELDYRIGLSGVVSKPPWDAKFKRFGIERQG